jgi:hypothetical protein
MPAFDRSGTTASQPPSAQRVAASTRTAFRGTRLLCSSPTLLHHALECGATRRTWRLPVLARCVSCEVWDRPRDRSAAVAAHDILLVLGTSPSIDGFQQSGTRFFAYPSGHFFRLKPSGTPPANPIFDPLLPGFLLPHHCGGEPFRGCSCGRGFDLPINARRLGGTNPQAFLQFNALARASWQDVNTSSRHESYAFRASLGQASSCNRTLTLLRHLAGSWGISANPRP